MSRYYKIVVGPETQVPVGQMAASQNAGATWTNLVNGKADLGAQTVELDIQVYTYDAPTSQAYVKIWGIPKLQVSQASDFNGASISVYGGMQPGLPLATAAVNNGQQGLLLQGQVFQAFGNWQGINQSLDFVVTTDFGSTQSDPGNLSFTWPKGQPLNQMVAQTLLIAYPSLAGKIQINVDPTLVLTQDEHGVFQTLQQFSSYVTGVSQDIKGGNYPGVRIAKALAGGVIVFDGTTNVPTPTQILVQDLIGSVTWLDVATIQFTTVMRADLSVSSTVQFPPLVGAQAITTPQSGSNARIQNTFNGTWTVTFVRHVGNSRDPNAQSWVSTFQAVTNTVPPASYGVGATSA